MMPPPLQPGRKSRRDCKAPLWSRRWSVSVPEVCLGQTGALTGAGLESINRIGMHWNCDASGPPLRMVDDHEAGRVDDAVISAALGFQFFVFSELFRSGSLV
jgi:hypothetical protein